MLYRVKLIVLALALFISGCSTMPHANEDPALAPARAMLPELDMNRLGPTPESAAYIGGFLNLTGPERYVVGAIETRVVRTGVHVLIPEGGIDAAVGSVFVLHGYGAEPLAFASTARLLLERGYVVVGPHLPGHGLSDGERGAIGSIDEYGDWLADVVTAMVPRVPQPFHVIAFSTGAIATYEYIRRIEDPFGAVIFSAPLVRSAFWHTSRVARVVAAPFTRTVQMLGSSPMSFDRMPLSWFDRLVEWNRRAVDFAPIERPLLVLQGTADTVVDWRYNMSFLTERFPAMQLEVYEGQVHTFLFGATDEGRRARELVVRWIEAWPAVP